MGRAVLLLDDGGYLVIGESAEQLEPQELPHIYLVRLDASGDVVWEKSSVEGRLSGGSSAIAVDDGFMVAGTVQSDDGDDAEILLLHIDSDGNEIWWQRYGTELFEHGGDLMRMADDGFAVIGNCVDPNDIVADPGAAGYAGFAERSDVYVVRTDANGNEIWARRFDRDENIVSSGGVATADGGIVILAYVLLYPLDDNDIVLFKIDADGNEVWSRTWDAGKASGYDLIGTSDGGYLICGTQSFPDGADQVPADALLIKVDEDGYEIWQTTFGDRSLSETAHVVTETRGGQYVIAGWQQPDLYTYVDSILLVAVDANGIPVWAEVTPTTAHNTFGEIHELPDGSFVIVGAVAIPGRPFRLQVIRTDPAPRAATDTEP
ncbi:PQQ-binding-like beta-propeller repeat protein [Candidatus Bipolaricaulota bacterium]|nr:PQQ-binding-like beta-propeller repeat protein [Candidatus Bipolaricaulota bacterium]